MLPTLDLMSILDKDNNDNNDTRKQENRQKAANTAPMAYRMPHDRDRRVYIILHQDGMIVTILGVYEELQDANRDCLFQASQGGHRPAAGITHDGPRQAPPHAH
ncbi:hypothetical protein TrVGV298_002708 [Trichoderma virens]|nr:hypothetical protein TrVGV298_002708 [Trichoderma virens]